MGELCKPVGSQERKILTRNSCDDVISYILSIFFSYSWFFIFWIEYVDYEVVFWIEQWGERGGMARKKQRVLAKTVGTDEITFLKIMQCKLIQFSVNIMRRRDLVHAPQCNGKKQPLPILKKVVLLPKTNHRLRSGLVSAVWALLFVYTEKLLNIFFTHSHTLSVSSGLI